MGALFRFIAWVAANINRWGAAVARHYNRIVAWINANAQQVLAWINGGVAFGTIFEWILRILGIG
ncbi:aureocin A53 family class IId bacteriocin [Microbacterium lacticum]